MWLWFQICHIETHFSDRWLGNFCTIALKSKCQSTSLMIKTTLIRVTALCRQTIHSNANVWLYARNGTAQVASGYQRVNLWTTSHWTLKMSETATLSISHAENTAHPWKYLLRAETKKVRSNVSTRLSAWGYGLLRNFPFKIHVS